MSEPRECSADGCNLPYYCRGFCKRHYDKDLKARNPGYAERQRQNVRRWVAENPERKRRSDAATRRREDPALKRDRRFRSKYGLTSAQVEQLLAAQGGNCAICRQRRAAWHVDHCHATGVVRGVLCSRCNVGLGYFDEDPHLIREALTYLDRIRDEHHGEERAV